MGFAEAIEPMRNLKCVAILFVNLILARSRAIEHSGSVGGNMTGDRELDGRPLFVVCIKLPIVSGYIRSLKHFHCSLRHDH
ncbi:hypothetical protein BDV28DRAFT_128556 [Aspergillus coremiiformis]|uniref:Secreted protein n=1 Tax=Aspergillus coremiiformis TaxID=138285 RepID=A0A5N6ZDE3_9EURO|nr:hypothetical protein BDV28DRAFT_128556 [Aspergillus coremiiformis]